MLSEVSFIGWVPFNNVSAFAVYNNVIISSIVTRKFLQNLETKSLVRALQNVSKRRRRIQKPVYCSQNGPVGQASICYSEEAPASSFCVSFLNAQFQENDPHQKHIKMSNVKTFNSFS